MAGLDLLVCGAINWDVTLFVDRLPLRGEEVTVKELSRVPGGTAANVAVAAARLLGRGRVGFLGAVGNDEIGRSQRAILDGEGVQTQGLSTVARAESGQAYILVDREGSNVIASALGANLALTVEHLHGAGAVELVRAARLYAVTDPPLPVVEALIEAAAEADAHLLWDPGVHVERGWDVLRDPAGRVDTLLLNQVEAERLLGTAEQVAVSRRLLAAGWRNQVVLKRGGEGAVLLDLASRHYYAVPALPLEALGLRAVSSVGSGDAFLGALAALRSRGYGPGEALARAACAGGLKASRPGTRDSPTWAELEDAFARWTALGIGLEEAPLPD